MRTATLYASVMLISATTAIGTTVVIHMVTSGQWRSGLFARGDERVVVPNLVGNSEKDARENLHALGLVFLRGPRQAKGGAEPDTVIAQSTAAGQSARRGDAITLTFARAAAPIPNLIGRSIAEATYLASQQDLKLEQGPPLGSNEVAAGQIASQEPAAGVADGQARAVVVRVSSGPSEAVVPKILGQPINKAKEALKQAGLELGQITWLDQGETPVDVVLNQRPLPDTKVKPGDKVSITVNH